MNNEPPQKPRVSDFGLSDARIRYLEDTNCPLATYLGLFSIGLTIIIFRYLYNLLHININQLVVLGGLCIWAIFFVLNKSCEKVIQSRRKKHPDYPKYMAYKEACSQYESALFKLRLEEDKKKRKELNWWLKLDGHAFEREFTELLKRKGYSARNTRHSGDEGVDIYAEKDNTSIIIQCKAHKSYISPATVRELYGTLAHTRADEAWLVATKGFSSGAKAFAEGKPLKLFTIEDFL